MDRYRKLLILLTPLLLSLGGCSTVTFGYNHGDWLLRYWINGYTSFDSRQKETIHVEVDDYMRWHRSNALPAYTLFLQGIDEQIQHNAPLTAADIAQARAALWQLYKITMQPMIPPAARVLHTLDNKQIKELGRNLAEQNSEYREENLQGSEQEILALRAKRHIDITEDLAGYLDLQQKEAIRVMSLMLPNGTREYIDQREAKHSALISLLDSGGSEDEIASLFRQWIDTPWTARPEHHQQSITTYDHALNEMIAQIFNLLTPGQKHHLHKKMTAYIHDFKQLAPASTEIATPQRQNKYAIDCMDSNTDTLSAARINPAMSDRMTCL